MAETSEQHRYQALIDAALRIYRKSMREFITSTLDSALGGDWYESWLEERVKQSSKKDGRSKYVHNLHRARKQRIEPRWLIEESDFPDIIEAHGSVFTSGVRALVQPMRETVEDADKPAAREQMRRIQENCITVLQAVDPDAAEQVVGQLFKAGKLAKPWEADVGALRRSVKRGHALHDIFESYRDTMRPYIRATLQQAHYERTKTDNWFRELVIEMWDNPNKKRMDKAFSKKGESFEEIVDVNDFPFIIRYNQGDFPEVLGDGTYDDLFEQIHNARNTFPGHSKRKPSKKDVENVARDCATILELCEDDRATAAAEEIRQHLQGDEDPRPIAASPPPETAGAPPPAHSIGPASANDPKPNLLLGSDREEQDMRRRETDALNHQNLGAGGRGSELSGVALEEADDGDRAPPILEESSQRRSWVARLGLFMAAVLVVAIVIYVVLQDALSSTTTPPPVAAPVLDPLTCLPERPAVGETVTCSASLSGGEPDSWLWNAGDEPATEGGPSFSTVFDSPGRPTISLAVANAGGDASNMVTLVVGAPEIDMDCRPASPVVGEMVRCTAVASGGESDSWSWSGGGAPPTGEGDAFSTTFSAPASRTITLTVENAADSDSESFVVQVLPAPAAPVDNGQTDADDTSGGERRQGQSDPSGAAAPSGDSQTDTGNTSDDDQSQEQNDPPETTPTALSGDNQTDTGNTGGDAQEGISSESGEEDSGLEDDEGNIYTPDADESSGATGGEDSGLEDDEGNIYTPEGDGSSGTTGGGDDELSGDEGDAVEGMGDELLGGEGDALNDSDMMGDGEMIDDEDDLPMDELEDQEPGETWVDVPQTEVVVAEDNIIAEIEFGPDEIGLVDDDDGLME